MTTAETNTQGFATAIARANGSAGSTAGVSISVDGTIFGEGFGLINTPAPDSLVVSVPANQMQTTLIGTAFGESLFVRATNNGTAVNAASITFTATPNANGATAVLSSTNPSATTLTLSATSRGDAGLVLPTANGIAGTYTVRATTAGFNGFVDFTLTNVARVLTKSDGDKQKAKVDPKQDEDAELDAFAPLRVTTTLIPEGTTNALRENAVVTFALSDDSMATLSATTDTTEADGIAEIVVTPKNKAGEYTITATTIGTPETAEAVVFNLSNEAASGFCFPVMGANATAVICL